LKSASASSLLRSALTHCTKVATSIWVWASARPAARAARIRMPLVRPDALACSPFQRDALHRPSCLPGVLWIPGTTVTAGGRAVVTPRG
jgi:hypothetical protein